MSQNNDAFNLNPQILMELVTTRLSFGKYKDRLLCDLPVSYLEWFNRKGFPPGKIGEQLSAVYEIKMNGLEYLLKPLKKQGFTNYHRDWYPR